MTRNVAQNTRPSFCFSGEGCGDEIMYNSCSGEPGNEAMLFAIDKRAGQELERSGIYTTNILTV